MPRISKLALVLTILILLSFAAPAVDAVTMIIGSSDSLSRYPFGLDPSASSGAFPDFGAGGVYQQVYAVSAFSVPLTATCLEAVFHSRRRKEQRTGSGFPDILAGRPYHRPKSAINLSW